MRVAPRVNALRFNSFSMGITLTPKTLRARIGTLVGGQCEPES